ncbi:MAG: hypothetical protein M3Y27_20290, partial [Acidobacteriota bacterium]|nr:hypothetical protein [Acidobacteriota bacterium]
PIECSLCERPIQNTVRDSWASLVSLAKAEEAAGSRASRKNFMRWSESSCGPTLRIAVNRVFVGDWAAVPVAIWHSVKGFVAEPTRGPFHGPFETVR